MLEQTSCQTYFSLSLASRLRRKDLSVLSVLSVLWDLFEVVEVRRLHVDSNLLALEAMK